MKNNINKFFKILNENKSIDCFNNIIKDMPESEISFALNILINENKKDNVSYIKKLIPLIKTDTYQKNTLELIANKYIIFDEYIDLILNNFNTDNFSNILKNSVRYNNINLFKKIMHLSDYSTSKYCILKSALNGLDEFFNLLFPKINNDDLKDIINITINSKKPNLNIIKTLYKYFNLDDIYTISLNSFSNNDIIDFIKNDLNDFDKNTHLCKIAIQKNQYYIIEVLINKSNIEELKKQLDHLDKFNVYVKEEIKELINDRLLNKEIKLILDDELKKSKKNIKRKI